MLKFLNFRVFYIWGTFLWVSGIGFCHNFFEKIVTRFHEYCVHLNFCEWYISFQLIVLVFSHTILNRGISTVRYNSIIRVAPEWRVEWGDVGLGKSCSWYIVEDSIFTFTTWLGIDITKLLRLHYSLVRCFKRALPLFKVSDLSDFRQYFSISNFREVYRFEMISWRQQLVWSLSYQHLFRPWIVFFVLNLKEFGWLVLWRLHITVFVLPPLSLLVSWLLCIFGEIRSMDTNWYSPKVLQVVFNFICSLLFTYLAFCLWLGQLHCLTHECILSEAKASWTVNCVRVWRLF